MINDLFKDDDLDPDNEDDDDLSMCNTEELNF